MMNTVLTKTYSPPPFDFGEILRYLNAGKDFLSESQIAEYIRECENELTYKVCYLEFPLRKDGESFDFSFMKVHSSLLQKNLEGCSSVIVFSATIGLFIDRIISKYSKISPSKALFFQALGSERIESLVNTFNSEIESEFFKKGLYTRVRISPGYGDFPLECQKDILNALDSSRKIGVSLNESLIMSPSKSVTAIIGISDTLSCSRKTGCSICTKKDCVYRDDKNEC